LQVEYAEISLIGAREENQDRIASAISADAALIAAFDGMGGHADGARAAVDPLSYLHVSLGAAHTEMVGIGTHLPMEQRPRATAAVCVVQDGTAWTAHVGDSRVYHLRAGKVLSRTRDHSHVELLLQEGLINSDQAMNHPLRNYVEACLGGDPMLPEMLIGRAVRVEPGDTLLVCTDGFWSNLLDEDIAASLYSGVPVNIALQAVAEFAVRRGGPSADNTSVAALKVL
jgi:PPM family protein phosphatase